MKRPYAWGIIDKNVWSPRNDGMVTVYAQNRLSIEERKQSARSTDPEYARDGEGTTFFGDGRKGQ